MSPGATRRVSMPLASLAAGLLAAAQPFLGLPASTAQAVSAPVLIAPLGAASTVEPLLDWLSVADAKSYRVQISASSTFVPLTYDIATVGSEATPQADLAPGTWFWRVQASVGGQAGPWSASTFVKTASLTTAPTQLTPPDGAVIDVSVDAAVLSWDPVPDASSYQIEFSTAPGMTDPFWADMSTTSFVVDFAAPGEPLYWHVRAFARNQVSAGPWSAIRSFETGFQPIPTLVSPADGASVRDVNLEWSPLPGVASYDLEVTPGPAPVWSSPDTTHVGTRATRYQFEDANAPIPTTWAWRVRARDAVGSVGPWTTPRLVTRVLSTAPSLAGPDSGSTVGENPTLSWTSVVRAGFYQVDLSQTVDFGTGVATYITTETTFDVPSNDLSPFVLVKGATYYWRVRGIDNPPGQMLAMHRPASPWSGIRTFVYEPAITTLVSPADGATVLVPTLTWHPVNALHHRVTIKDKNGAIVDRSMTFADSYTPAVQLDGSDGPFSWYVERVAEPGDSGAVVAWKSATRTFNLGISSASASTPTPLLPNGAHSPVTPSLTWTPVVGADHYNIFPYADFPHDTPPAQEPSAWNPQPLHYPAFTYALGNLDVRSYPYVIRAYDVAGNVLAHGPPSTFVIDALDAPTITGPADCAGQGCPILADSPRLSWEPVDGAIRYHAGTDSFSTWNPGMLTMGTSAVLQKDLDRTSPGPGLDWWVYACVEQRCSPAARAKVEEALPAVPQISPATDEVVDGPQVTFSWGDLIGAPTPVGYVGVHRSEANVYDFGFTGEDNGGGSTVDGLESTLLLPSGSYEWHVYGYTASVGTPDVRVPFTVVHAGPTLTSPGIGASIPRTPVLSWNAAPYMEAYQVEVFRGTSTDVADRVLAATATAPSYTPTDELDAGTYTWRIRTMVNGAPSDWSERTFTIEAGSAPALAAPIDGLETTIGVPLFDWSDASGAVAYRFESSLSPGFASPYQSVVTGQTAWEPLTTYPSARWYWRVAALGAGNAVLAYSAIRQVVIDRVAPVVGAPVAKLPTVGAAVSTSGAGSVSASWSGSDALTGLAAFDVAIRVDGGPLTVVAAGIATTSLTKVLSPGHDYRLAVRAKDVVGNTSAWVYGSAFELRRFNEGSAAITFSGGWKQADSATFVGGGVRYSTAAGAVATFTFTGRQVIWIASMGPSRGRAKVFVDGVLKATIDLNSPAIAARRVVFRRAWSTVGPHKVRIVVSGITGHSRIDVDAFLVVR